MVALIPCEYPKTNSSNGYKEELYFTLLTYFILKINLSCLFIHLRSQSAALENRTILARNVSHIKKIASVPSFVRWTRQNDGLERMAY